MKQRSVLCSLELQHSGRSETKASSLLWVRPLLPSLQTASEALPTPLGMRSAPQLYKNPAAPPAFTLAGRAGGIHMQPLAPKGPLISAWVMPHSRVKITGQPETKELGVSTEEGRAATEAVRAGATDLKDPLASA